MARLSLLSLLLALLALLAPASCQIDDEYGDDDEYGGMAGGGGAESRRLPLLDHIMGWVDVDRHTFDQVVLRGQPSFVTFYSTDDEERTAADVAIVLETVSEQLRVHLRLLLAKVDVTSDDAALLRARYGRATPFHLFFANATSEPVAYEMDAAAPDAAEKLLAYLTDRTGHPLEIAAFTPLVQQFAVASDRAQLLEQAEAVLLGLTPSEAVIGRYYLKVFSQMVKHGPAYVEREFQRLTKLLGEPAALKADKVAEFQLRRAIVSIFSGGKLQSDAA